MANSMLQQLFTEIKDTVISKIHGNKKEVALVLSCGGARGLVHIGAIEALEDRGYHIHSIAGTSMGALIAGMYAAGKLEDYREWMKTIDKKKIRELTDFSPNFDHLVKGKRIIEVMKKIVPDTDIEQLRIPYAAVATDWESGHEVVFEHGSLYRAIRASISLPGFFSPVKAGGRVLIDGGTTNPLPLNRVKRKKGDLLVAVNVAGHDYKQEAMLKKMAERRRVNSSLPLQIIDKILPNSLHPEFNYYTLLNRTASIMIHQNTELSIRLTPPDILLNMPLKRYGGFDYDKSERLVRLGYMGMSRLLDEYES